MAGSLVVYVLVTHGWLRMCWCIMAVRVCAGDSRLFVHVLVTHGWSCMCW
jgi:hypothetical protein